MIILQVASFFTYEKWFESWKKAEKKGKIKRKKLQKIFCLGASTWREEMPLIKVAYFMLNFLNLKSFLRHLFFWVASCLSTLWMTCSNRNCILSLLDRELSVPKGNFVAIPIPDTISGCITGGKNFLQTYPKRFYT